MSGVSGPAVAAPAPALRVVGGTWLDTATGGTTRADLLLVDGRVVADDGRPAMVVDAGGATLLWGLWDCHVHPGEAFYATGGAWFFEDAATRTIRAGENLAAALRAGVTGVRCLDEADGIDLAWGRAYAAASTPGPRLLGAGRAIRTTGGHGTFHPRVPVGTGGMHVADGPVAMARAVRAEVERGAHWIKVMLTGGLASEHETVDGAQLTDDELAAVMAAARQRGVPVAAHCGGAATAIRFARLGGRSVEHGYVLDEEAAAVMVEHGTWLVPTIGVTHDDEFIAGGDGDGWPEHSLARARATRRRHAESLAIARAAGVRIAVGADLNPVAVRLHRELALLEAAGMPRLEVLHAATVGGRELNGVGSGSTPRSGEVADLLVLDGDPRDDLAALASPRHVVVRGRRVAGAA